MRGKRICSTPEAFDSYRDILNNAFSSRDYPPKLTHSQLTRASHSNSNIPHRDKSTKMSLVTQFHPGFHKFNQILRQGYHILQSSPLTRNLLPTCPTVSFRRPANMKNILTTYEPRQPKPSPGSVHCNRNRCLTCPMHIPSTNFSSINCNSTFQITKHSNCSSSNIIYLHQHKGWRGSWDKKSTSSFPMKRLA